MKKHRVSSSRRTQRRNQLGATSSVKRKLMNCHLIKSFLGKYKVRSVPIKRGDEVKILKGKKRQIRKSSIGL